MERPNIVVILSDEHTGSAAGWAGHPRIQTPHPDRLAAQSVFDLDADPLELDDLAARRPDMVARLDAALRAILDPDQTNDRAQAEQAARANGPTVSAGR